MELSVLTSAWAGQATNKRKEKMRTIYLTVFLALIMAITLWLASLYTAQAIAKAAVRVQEVQP